MKIKVSDIPTLERIYTFEIGCDHINQTLIGREDISCNQSAKGTVGINRIENTCNLRGRVSIPSSFTCARCSEELESDTNIRFKLVLTKSESRNPEDEDEGFGTYQGYEIDLLQLCVEQIIEKLPNMILCSPNCKGLCYICGANLNETECKCER